MKIGIEKETLLYNANFTPFNLKKQNLTNHIKVDYCDNQSEIISLPTDNIYQALKNIDDSFNNEIFNDKYLWPLSQPAIIDYDETFDSLTPKEQAYRKILQKKYPKALMLTSGIHFNFSIQNMTKDQYFNLMKNLYEYLPIIIQFVSFTPLYQNGCNDEDLNSINNNKGYSNSISLRNSIKHGYYNEHLLNLDFTNVDAYLKSIDTAIKNNLITSTKELYSKIRLKYSDNQYYLELRFIDINPFTRLGITIEQISLLQKIINHLSTISLTNFNFNNAINNTELVCLNGQNKNIKLTINNCTDTLHNHTINLLGILGINTDIYDDLDITKMIDIIITNNYTIKQFGKKYSHIKNIYTEPYENDYLELSTKILIHEALKQNKEVKILDQTQSVISINNNLVVQATKTNIDRYANILMLENKYMTKQILAQHNINTPKGQTYLKSDTIDYYIYLKKDIVIKPVNTNFGIGITILHKSSILSEIKKAFKLAFSHDIRVIVEEFFKGEEYRFLVINNKVVSIVKRIPCNIIGNSKNTIKELIEMKNKNPLRGIGYKKPVEKINITDYEINFIKKQGYTLNDILDNDQTLYLRENSNISTGGDSIEVSDLINPYYKQIAITATKHMNVSICGIDMILDEYQQNYVIIEANFNPAIQMHTYPYYGIGKNPAIEILKLLER